MQAAVADVSPLYCRSGRRLAASLLDVVK